MIGRVCPLLRRYYVGQETAGDHWKRTCEVVVMLEIVAVKYLCHTFPLSTKCSFSDLFVAVTPGTKRAMFASLETSSSSKLFSSSLALTSSRTSSGSFVFRQHVLLPLQHPPLCPKAGSFDTVDRAACAGHGLHGPGCRSCNFTYG